MEGVWATIFICHLIFGGHLLNIPKLLERVAEFCDKRQLVTVNKDLLSIAMNATDISRAISSFVCFSFSFSMFIRIFRIFASTMVNSPF